MAYGFDAFDDPLGQYKPRPQQPMMDDSNAFAPGGFGTGFEAAPLAPEDMGPPAGMAAPAFRPPMAQPQQPMATPRQMANADPNAEYLKRLDEGAIGDMSSALRDVGGAIAGAGRGAYNWLAGADVQLPQQPQRLAARNMGPMVGPAQPKPQAQPGQAFNFPTPQQNYGDIRREGLTSQGFTEAMPGQFIKISSNSNRPMNQMRDQNGVVRSWTPAGGGTISGANSFQSPDIAAGEQISDNDRLAAVAASHQRLAAAQMQPQQAHPDPFQQRTRAAAMLSQLPDAQFRKVLEALNAMVRGNYDQSALPLELQPPQ